MNATLLKALAVLVVALILFFWSRGIFSKKKNTSSLLQLLGAGFLIVVAIVHIFEALQLFTFMHWGSPHSVGHYLDFTSATLGLILFPLGMILHWFEK